MLQLWDEVFKFFKSETIMGLNSSSSWRQRTKLGEFGNIRNSRCQLSNQDIVMMTVRQGFCRLYVTRSSIFRFYVTRSFIFTFQYRITCYHLYGLATLRKLFLSEKSPESVFSRKYSCLSYIDDLYQRVVLLGCGWYNALISL